jgi:hypothetical protein
MNILAIIRITSQNLLQRVGLAGAKRQPADTKNLPEWLIRLQRGELEESNIGVLIFLVVQVAIAFAIPMTFLLHH